MTACATWESFNLARFKFSRLRHHFPFEKKKKKFFLKCSYKERYLNDTTDDLSRFCRQSLNSFALNRRAFHSASHQLVSLSPFFLPAKILLFADLRSTYWNWAKDFEVPHSWTFREDGQWLIIYLSIFIATLHLFFDEVTPVSITWMQDLKLNTASDVKYSFYICSFFF